MPLKKINEKPQGIGQGKNKEQRNKSLAHFKKRIRNSNPSAQFPTKLKKIFNRRLGPL